MAGGHHYRLQAEGDTEENHGPPQAGHDGTEGCFSGQLRYKENLGSDVFLHLETKGFEQRVVLRVKPNEAGFAELGETIFYALNRAR